LSLKISINKHGSSKPLLCYFKKEMG